MKHILLLTALLISSSVVALEPLKPMLTRQYMDMCYYDDGSVIKSLSCPLRLSVSSEKSSRPNGLLMSDESREWYMKFGQQTADGVRQGLANIIKSSNKSTQQNADDAIKNKALADYVSKTYGQDGENLRELIMTGVIDSSNFKVFVD
jgi:hypothetical protein|tara:strand:- start:406 stop:849 length:444 start_codon:yes stop_codon:yes gene_type:complete